MDFGGDTDFQEFVGCLKLFDCHSVVRLYFLFQRVTIEFSKILLNSVYKLEKIVPKENNEVQQVVKVLKDFKTKKKTCALEKKVKSDYRVAIKEFEASYKLLGISVTPKVHAVLDHIKDFFVD